MATLARRLARAEAERDEAIEYAASVEGLDGEYHRLVGVNSAEKERIFQLEVLVNRLRLETVTAQRALRDDIRTPCYECGQPWRPPNQRKIGYDPDEDPQVQADIA